MQKRKLGKEGLEVSTLGLGCMGMSWAYGNPDDVESIKVIHRALDIGINFFDTAELYGPFTNEELLGQTFKGSLRQNVIIATKFGWKFKSNGEMDGLDSSPTHVRKAVEGSLKRLKTDYIDLCYQHRLDPNVPIEDTVGTLSSLVKEGKVKYIGLSEVGPGTIRRAHAVHPLSAIQSEYSLWELDIEKKVLPVLHELGIGFVAYSPLGRGLLTGKIKSLNDLDSSDMRRKNPRFQDENFEHNFKLVEIIQRVASTYNATPAQIALAWIFRADKNIVPIPGTKQIKYLEENVQAIDMNLPESAWIELDEAISSFEVAGTRQPEGGMKLLDQTE